MAGMGAARDFWAGWAGGAGGWSRGFWEGSLHRLSDKHYKCNSY